MNNKERGYLGQQYVIHYLQKKRYIILEENWTIQGGEIDIIALYKNKYIFIEVKTRSTNRFGIGLESLSERQKTTLCRTIETYVLMNDIQNKYDLDIIEVVINKRDQSLLYINHFTDVL